MIDEQDQDQFFRKKLDDKKYSKKKTLKTGLKKVATALLYTTLGLMVVPEISNVIKINTQDHKSNSQIIEDAHYFDADMRVAQYFGNSNFLIKTDFRRLPHNNDKPIYVGVSNVFDENEKVMIKDVLLYYEDLFSNINSHYKFKVVNVPEAYFQSIIGNNVLYYFEKNINGEGLNASRPNLLNFNFTKNSIITIDKNLTDEVEKYYTVMHETAHCFGLGDVYETSVRHFDTFMHGSPLAHDVKTLYPNDVAMLYAMYGEDFRNEEEINQTKLLQAQNSFENYKDIFYDKAIKSITEKYLFNNIAEIDQETINNKVFNFYMNIYNEKTLQLEEFIYKIKIDSEKDATFSITNEQNELLWQTPIKYDYYNGALFLPSVYFESGQFPSVDPSENSVESAEFFVIAKFNGVCQFFAPDSNFKTILTLGDKDLDMPNQQKVVFMQNKEHKHEKHIEF